MSDRTARRAGPVRKARPTRGQEQNPDFTAARIAERIGISFGTLVLLALAVSTRQRGLFVASAVALLGGLATAATLRHQNIGRGAFATHVVVVALILLELAWALGYWTGPPLVAAAALWLGVYVLTGLVEQGNRRVLDGRSAREYASVAGVGILASVVAELWLG